MNTPTSQRQPEPATLRPPLVFGRWRRIGIFVTALSLAAVGTAGGAPLAASAVAPSDVLTTTPSPTITGSPTVGSTLSASTGTWGPGAVTFAFKWYSGGVAVAGSTASTYLVTAADIGKKITLTVTGSEAGFTSVSKSSGATVTVVAGAFTSTPSPTITGSPAVGATLSAATGTWAPGPVTFAFKWFSADVAIAGATASTYTVTSADIGKKITLTVTGSRPGFTSVSKSSGATGTVPTPAGLTPPSTPTVAFVGGNLDTLAPAIRVDLGAVGAHPGFSDSQVTFLYDLNGSGSWLPMESLSYNDSDQPAFIPCTIATGCHYAHQGVVAGQQYTLRFIERGTVNGVSYDSAPTAPQGPATATGFPDPAYQITTSVSGSKVTFSWDLTKALNGNAPDLYFSTDAGDQGFWSDRFGTSGIVGSLTYDIGYDGSLHLVLNQVYGDGGTYWNATATTGAPPSSTLPLASTPLPTIVGTANIGATITARPGTWQPAPVTLAYQWNHNGTPIPGATGVNYAVTAADSGYQLSVSVTGSKTGYTSATVTSAPTPKVAGATLSTVTPTIGGTAKFGQTLTANAGTWGPGSVSLVYRWARNGSTIAGATAKTYKLVAADIGQQITVTVTGSKAGYTPVTLTSAPSQAVAALPLTATPVPTVSGTAAVGQTLTAKPGTWSPAPVALTYQWSRGGASITGATAATYRLVAADAGKAITVTVTGTKAGYTTTSKTSTATTP